ncbi:prolow-density lipoprotein receptor-related protein 1-like [Ylistrum balloti]|uniref:prolow-density lipoprotein receptor-related protein 1-like n=1 Tax=Ylistrum balloti TaxID=509963 RepID=UPI002905A6CC|nr:prolow-density lipoprotein receptor-related protein 1-like [Ylistrum balloti]
MARVKAVLRHIYIITSTLVTLKVCQDVYHECEPLRASVCEFMPYNYTILPNILNDNSQDDAIMAISQYSPLLKIDCSTSLLPFLCVLYLPVCTVMQVPLPPCRKLCDEVQAGCESIMNEFGYRWPERFNCTNFPTSGLCVGETHLRREMSSEGSTSAWSLSYPQFTTPKQMMSRPVDITLKPGSNEETTDTEVPVFILLSSLHKLLLYDVSTGDLITLYSGLDQGAAIDFHYSKKWIYWASHGDSRMYRGSLSLDVLTDVHLVVDAVSATIDSIAVDWITELLFWMETYPSQIRVATLDGKNPTTLLDENLDNPKSLVIDPIEGYLFWIDWVGTLYSPSASVERYSLNKSQHDVIFNITQEILPNMGRSIGLCTDHPNKRLYWVDAKSESVQTITYDGTSFRVIVKSTFRNGLHNHNFLSEPRSVAIFGKNAFWSDRATQSVVKARKDGSSKVKMLKTLTASAPLDLKVFHALIQPSGTSKYKIQLMSSCGVLWASYTTLIATAVVLSIQMVPVFLS